MAERIVTRAFIEDGYGGVLVGLRTKERTWSLIGGKPNEGESPLDAVTREVSEELGVKFKDVYFYSMSENIPEDSDSDSWTTLFYTGRIGQKRKLDKKGILEVRVVRQSDLPQLEFAFDHRQRLIEFFNRHK